jgi:hypothetical protein
MKMDGNEMNAGPDITRSQLLDELCSVDPQPIEFQSQNI